MQPSKHRPLLSLDTIRLRKQSGYGLDSSSLPGRRTVVSSNPQSPCPWQGGDDTPDKLASKLHSFVKLSGSVIGNESEGERNAHSRLSATDQGRQNPMRQPAGRSTVEGSNLPDNRLNNSGPLLTHVTDGEAKVMLTLDRHIQYEADPSAASTWDLRNHRPATTSNPLNPSLGPAFQLDRVGEREGSASVPRSLLCFTLSLEPFQGETGVRSRENFEFISLQLDFKMADIRAQVRHQRTASSPCFSKSREHGAQRTSDASRDSLACPEPIVRGFAPMNLVSSNFLQDFGPILYRALHNEDGDSGAPAVLGRGAESSQYRLFERRLAHISKPIVIEGDKFTGRGCRAMASACPTPASATFRQACTPFGATDVEAAEYGTSSIRIMLKRDTEIETSWVPRKFPFLILLGQPAEAPSVEACIRLDFTTVRKSLHTVGTLRSSLSSRYRSPRRSDSSNETVDPGYESSTSRHASASPRAARRYGMHVRSLSEASVRSSSGRNVAKVEEIATIFPRSDPISVISCGSGTVKDTLYQTGVVPKGSAKSTAPLSAKCQQKGSNTTPLPRSVPSPMLNKPLPTPRLDECEPTQQQPQFSRSTNRPGCNPLHKHSNSSASIPSMYERSGNLGNFHKAQHSTSYDSSEGSIYSQDGCSKQDHFGNRSERGLHTATDMHDAPNSRQASIGSSWTKRAESVLPPTPVVSSSRPRLDSIPVTHQTESDGEIFDMVLTNWQAVRMEREPTYALPLPGSPSR